MCSRQDDGPEHQGTKFEMTMPCRKDEIMMTTCNFAVSTEGLILLFHYYRSQRLVANGSPLGRRSRSVPAPIVASVPPDTNGLGYTGMSYLHTTVKTLAIATTVNRTFYPPSFEAVALADYPLSRLTYFGVNKVPKQPLPAALQQFLRFLLSSKGQSIVLKQGLFLSPAAWMAS